MGLRHIIPILALLFELQGLIEADPSHSALPQLKDNRLAKGADKYLPNAQPIECGEPKINTGRLTQNREITLAPMAYLSTFPFTAGPVEFQRPLDIVNNIGKFTFAEMKGKHMYVDALQVNPLSDIAESGYWLPRGGVLDIPRHPNEDEPQFVFTPDFNGSSWTVTPLGDKYLRLRHVEDGKEATQFNGKSEDEKGGPTTYAMQYKDYGYLLRLRPIRLIGNITAFAYMHYGGGSWSLTYQRKTCATITGGYQFNDNGLSSVTMVDYRSLYNPVTGTEDYSIP